MKQLDLFYSPKPPKPPLNVSKQQWKRAYQLARSCNRHEQASYKAANKENLVAVMQEARLCWATGNTDFGACGFIDRCQSHIQQLKREFYAYGEQEDYEWDRKW